MPDEHAVVPSVDEIHALGPYDVETRARLLAKRLNLTMSAGHWEARLDVTWRCRGLIGAFQIDVNRTPDRMFHVCVAEIDEPWKAGYETARTPERAIMLALYAIQARRQAAASRAQDRFDQVNRALEALGPG